MAKKENKNFINLLPQEEFESSSFGRILNWLTTTFRYIVMGTEVIVMAAFLARFYFDARSSDLINQINQKKSIISSYSSFESQYRRIQNKLSLFSQYSQNANATSSTLQSIRNLVPSDVTLELVSLNNPKIQITIISQSESSALNFTKSLNSSGTLTNANISSVSSKDGSNVSYVIDAVIKGGS